MAKKVLNGLFLGVILLLLLAGLITTLLFPHDINTYENRYAEKVEPFSVRAFLDGSFQGSMDKALADQVNFAQIYKKIYNTGSSALLQGLVSPVLKAAPDRYVNFMGLRIFGGSHITYWTRSLSTMTEALDQRAENYTQIISDHPETDFFLYYIEKDTDIDFETAEKVGAYEYLREKLPFPEEQTACFRVDSFADYSEHFYRTDHHWNHVGSYLAYTEVLKLLGVEETPLQPSGTAELGTFAGSKSASIGADLFTETFSAYRFDFPELTVTVNGAPAEDYGGQESFLNGTASGVSYGGFYGGDMGEVILDSGTDGRGKLLVIGESYDNAILKLLASHFDCIYSVDLRYYETYMGTPFRLDDYLAAHDIDQVLLIGNIDYFIMPEFLLEN